MPLLVSSAQRQSRTKSTPLDILKQLTIAEHGSDQSGEAYYADVIWPTCQIRMQPCSSANLHLIKQMPSLPATIWMDKQVDITPSASQTDNPFNEMSHNYFKTILFS